MKNKMKRDLRNGLNMFKEKMKAKMDDGTPAPWPDNTDLLGLERYWAASSMFMFSVYFMSVIHLLRRAYALSKNMGDPMAKREVMVLVFCLTLSIVFGRMWTDVLEHTARMAADTGDFLVGITGLTIPSILLVMGVLLSQFKMFQCAPTAHPLVFLMYLVAPLAFGPVGLLVFLIPPDMMGKIMAKKSKKSKK